MKIELITPKAISVRSGLQAGNLNSDACYAMRNAYNIAAFIYGKSYYSDSELRACLEKSGDPNWKKYF